ncbi:MraY family glycosyltransferase [Tardiphaga sp. 841_E9_N1_2]|uniref:MraY family glycosyltransferase n=1 Tax=Tardiphaga sp. 841_E9_N1_2 TaxID=3240762 RepID=UPI003F22EDB7
MSSFELITTFIALVVAAVLSAVCINAIHPLLIRYAMARPNARSSHKVPTPQGAGIAVISVTLLVAGCSIASLSVSATPALWVLFGATILIATIGAIDDLRPISVAPRLLLQAVSIAAILFALPPTLQITPDLPLWIERGLLLLAALWFVNLVNFMDGLDWITVAEVIPITAALVLIGFSGQLPLSTALIAAALCGATLGFAPFNRPVAKMFLGDVGSLPIGLLLAWCFLQLAYAHHLAAAILLPLYYLADATITLLRRLAKREPVWLAHRSHFYQRATDNGFTVIKVVRTVFVLNIGLAALAGLSIYLRSAITDTTILVLGGIAVALVLRSFSMPRR